MSGRPLEPSRGFELEVEADAELNGEWRNQAVRAGEIARVVAVAILATERWILRRKKRAFGAMT